MCQESYEIKIMQNGHPITKYTRSTMYVYDHNIPQVE